MAHFAELDENNVVLRVVVVTNDALKDDGDEESEILGIAECVRIFGGGNWIQTSYNGKFRRRFAIVGGSYLPDRDAFIQPNPNDGSILNPLSLEWEFPNKPDVVWNKETQAWEIREAVDPNLLLESYHRND